MSLSTNCTQAITHNCNFNVLSGYSSWLDANDTVYSFWHGDRDKGKHKKSALKVKGI